MGKLEVIAGNIRHVGNSSSDAHCRTYDLLEIETSAGRVDLKTAVVAKTLSRSIKANGQLVMSVLQAGEGAKRRCVVLGIYVSGQRTHA